MSAAYFLVLASGAVALGQTANVTYVDTYTGVQYPARMAMEPGGDLYVTDPQSGQVVTFDATGTPTATADIPEGPVGVAVHTDGRVFLSRRDGQIGIYDAAFTSLGTVNPAPATLVAPNDMAFSTATKNLYVVDSGSHQVLVFVESAPDTWTLDRMWGTAGSDLGQLYSPQAIALNSALGHVIVADTDNYRVQVFDANGVVQYKFGYRILYAGESETAWFARAEGLGVDSCGNIYVTDALMGTVRVFDSLGNELDNLHLPVVGFGTVAGELRLPADLMITGDQLFLANTNNAAVEVFDIDCMTMSLTATADSPLKKRRPATTGRLGRASDLKGPLPDNPIEIVTAMEDGAYEYRLDINSDKSVNKTDLAIAVEHFGAGTVENFLLDGWVATAHPNLALPHIIDTPNKCGRCHSMDGLPGGMLSAEGQENLCLSCHSAGKIAVNTPIGGGDTENNHPWGVQAEPKEASSLNDHLDSGDVRCGTCHEPHDLLENPDYIRAQVPGDDDKLHLCGQCHQEYDEWLHAGHSDQHADPWSHYDWALPNRSACRQCHSGFGYIDHSEGLAPANQRGDFRVADCLVCHAAHGKPQNEQLLRIYGEATVPTEGPDETLTGLGTMATCYTCHNGRRAPDDGDLTPHYALGGVMLEGINANNFGFTLTNSQHHTLAEDSLLTCASCHMAPSPSPGNPGAGKVGGHTFNMVVHDASDPDFGFENVANSCGMVSCHPGLTSINRMANGDYDGDGTIEGIQDEVEALMALLLVAIEDKGAIQLGGYPYWNLGAVAPVDLTLVREAIWNWEYVDNSGDRGVKNTAYAVGALQVAFRGLTGVDVPGADLRYFP